MKDLKDTCRLASVQAAPVLFNKIACLDKVVALIHKCALQQAEFIVFPELFIPGYPYGMSFGFSVGQRTAAGRADWMRYYDASVVVPSMETEKIGQAAKAANAYVSIGVSERDVITATLYNTNLIFSPTGELISVHRKLKPTGSERFVWGDANKEYFPIIDTPWGPVGSLICWESYMPLARTVLYQKGVTIYLAPNTNDNPEWQYTMRHIAIEGRCYVVNSNMYFTKKDYPQDLNEVNEINQLKDIVCRGGSSIIDPYGHDMTEPLWDKEGILFADLAMNEVPAARMEFDVCGHYSRPDILELKINE